MTIRVTRRLFGDFLGLPTVALFALVATALCGQLLAAQELPPEILARAASGPKFFDSGQGQGAGFRPAAGSVRSALSGAGAGLRDAISASRANPLRSMSAAPPAAVAAESAARRQRLQAQRQVRRQIASRTTGQPTVRPAQHQVAHVLTPGFPTPEPLQTSAELDRSLTWRLNDLAERLGGTDFAVRVSGGKAVVTGTVADESYRGLVGRVLSLEPQIHEIDNRVTVHAKASPSTPAQSDR